MKPHAVCPTGHGEHMRRDRAHAQAVQVDVSRGAEEGLGAFGAAVVRSPQVMLPHCPVLGDRQEQVRRVLRRYPLCSIRVTAQDLYSAISIQFRRRFGLRTPARPARIAPLADFSHSRGPSSLAAPSQRLSLAYHPHMKRLSACSRLARTWPRRYLPDDPSQSYRRASSDAEMSY